MLFESTKTYTHANGLSACFRQWRADSHCKYLHGYALEVKIVFASDTLNNKNWVVDFGGLKEIKLWLENTFDHKTLVAHDDPEMESFLALKRAGIIDMVTVKHTGCEAFAQMIYERVKEWMTANVGQRVELKSVEVREHQGNSAVARMYP